MVVDTQGDITTPWDKEEILITLFYRLPRANGHTTSGIKNTGSEITLYTET